MAGSRLAQAQCPLPNPQPGTYDPCFTPSGSGFNQEVKSLALEPGGKILVGGDFTSFNGTDRNRIARLNADGTLDGSFNPGTGFNQVVSSIALQPDGKVIVGGSFTSFNGTARNRIARLNPDGTLDAGFDPGTGFNERVTSLVLLADGKVLVGGYYRTFNGTPRSAIARLNADGTLDGSFLPPTGASDFVNALALQPDGKLILGGDFATYTGSGRSYIFRLNEDGTLDGSFAPTGTGFNGRLFTLALQPDGKVVAGGWYSSFNGISRSLIARLNADGTLDTDYDPGVSFSTTFNALALQPDGKLIVGGAFSSFGGARRDFIARLKTNGTLDSSFASTIGFDNIVNTLALQPDGKVIVGGVFTSFNLQASTNITRLYANEASTPTALRPKSGPAGNAILVAGNQLVLTQLSQPSAYRITDLNGRLMQRGTAQPSTPIRIENVPTGVYALHLEQGPLLRLIKD